MKIVQKNQRIKIFNSMYPCEVMNIATSDTAEIIEVPEYATAYGYVINGSAEVEKEFFIGQGKFYCLAGLSIKVNPHSNIAVFLRYGFKGQNVIGGPVESSGRLMYIDGCSDSLLVYPPRLGDPSLNHLHFPRGINQSFHIHPSIRLGVVIRGSGRSDVKQNGEVESNLLDKDYVFLLEEREEHRFKTNESEMDVIAFHPDGDWGPTDHNHTMLNRTYLTK